MKKNNKIKNKNIIKKENKKTKNNIINNKIINNKKLKNKKLKNKKSEKKIKILTYLIIICLIVFFFIFSSTIVLAATPKLVNKIQSAFEDIEKWLIKLSTPAAAVALGTGVFMKKFSFGDEERMRAGKKVIRTTLFSYAFILAIDLVLSAIKSLV